MISFDRFRTCRIFAPPHRLTIVKMEVLPSVLLPRPVNEVTETPAGLAVRAARCARGVPGAEDLALCGICQEGDWEDDDKIIFCDDCNLAVHQTCYGSGARRIPDKAWYCDACTYTRRTGNKQLQECVLCPRRGGALKRTSDFRWAHIVCGLWIPEAEFLDPEGRDIIHPFGVNEKRLDLICSLCKQPGGACIQCKAPRCLTAFHVTCAQRKGLHMVEKEKDDHVEFVAFCEKHRPGGKAKRRKREIKW